MIVTTDIANIIYRDCGVFGIGEMYQDGNILDDEINAERIVIHSKRQTPGRFWKKCFVEVNLCVPDLEDGIANLVRLNELERMANGMRAVSGYDGSTYRYSIDSIGVERWPKAKCHYVNIRILFEILNVR